MTETKEQAERRRKVFNRYASVFYVVVLGLLAAELRLAALIFSIVFFVVMVLTFDDVCRSNY